MKKSEIKFTIELDEQNIPEKIFWEATDNPNGKMEETKAISISLWDNDQMNTMRIDLWSKDMRVDDMKMFFVETLAGLSETVRNSTGDEKMSSEMKDLVKKLIKLLEKEKQ